MHTLDVCRPHLKLIQKPRYGYGRNMNPCIDCRILMLQEAKSFMQTHGFSFLVSGEVLGQRPMSQRKGNLDIIDRDAQVKGLILRPLSAKLLEPTLAEEKGWVNRDKLFAFSGRSRKPQLALAKELGIKDYLAPAGGCLLAEAAFARKLQDLTMSGKFELDDVRLLRIGRHFRYSSLTKIIVGRNEQENNSLMSLAGDKDIIMKLRDFAGPVTVLRHIGSTFANGAIGIAARLTTRYSKGKEQKSVCVEYWRKSSGNKKSIAAVSAAEELIEQMRI